MIVLVDVEFVSLLEDPSDIGSEEFKLIGITMPSLTFGLITYALSELGDAAELTRDMFENDAMIEPIIMSINTRRMLVT